MNELINTTLSQLEIVFGGVGVPSIACQVRNKFAQLFYNSELRDMREIVVEMGHVYPVMFHRTEPGLFMIYYISFNVIISQKLW